MHLDMPNKENDNSDSNRESEDKGKHDRCARLVRDTNTSNDLGSPSPSNHSKVRKCENKTIGTGNRDIE